MKRLAFGLLCGLLAGGCASITRLDGGPCAGIDGYTPVETVQIMNTNWLLLSFIPIASGNVDRPDTCDCRWFTDTVTLQNQMNMLGAEAKRVGATRALNVVTSESGERALLFLLKREKIHTSAVLAKEVQPEPKTP